MGRDSFDEGSLVLVTLEAPRQKYFGRLLRLTLAGVELRGVGLESLTDLAQQIREGESTAVSTVFFPMHRVERMELDEARGELPSLAQEFTAKSGRPVEVVFGHGEQER